MPQFEVKLDNTDKSDAEEELLISSATDVADAIAQAITQATEDAAFYDEATVDEFDTPAIV